MDKLRVSNILDIIRRNLEANNSQKHFCALSHEFYELFCTHYTLIENLNALEKSLVTGHLSVTVAGIREKLESNVKHIIGILELLTNRTFAVHISKDSDTLWKIAKKYNSSIEEMCELNNIKNVFKINENRILLIPINHT